MPHYHYISKALNGESHSGVLEAENEHELARVLRQEGYILISFKQEGAKTPKLKFNISIPFLGKVSLKEKLFFGRNLKVMISAGISLPRALANLAGQTKSKKFKKTLSALSEEITEGENFSDCLAKHSDIFSEVFISMIKAGEESGTLEEVLEVLIRQMEKENELKSKIKGAMVYPSVIIAAMIIVGILMLILVIPKLAETFDQLGVELPFTTRMVIASGRFLANFWYLLPLAVFFIFFLLRFVLKTRSGKRLSDSILLKIPIASSLVKKTNSAYTARNLGSLITAGVSIVRALEITAATLPNVFYKEALLDASQKVKKGNKLSESLNEYQNIYPSLVAQMLTVGEETGETSKMLEKLADFFEDEVTNIAKNLSSIIEPVLMLLIGGAIGFFAVSIFQPIYSIMDTIK